MQRCSWSFLRTVAAAVLAIACDASVAADTEQPQFTADGQLIRPENYRSWVTLGSGLNMAYGPLRDAAAGRPVFTNVFVGQRAYRSFLQTGAWPDRTIFILEARAAAGVNKADKGGNGYFQGDLLAIEAEVKDTKRFEGGWAFFNLNPKTSSGPQFPKAAPCYSCHATNAAVENTFVQFYPELRDVAKTKGTLKQVPEVF
jgi:hypothetical protein